VPDQGFMTRGRRAQDQAARGLPVRFVDFNDVVCGMAPAPCATERDGVVLYTDDNHITKTFSRSLSVPIGERLAEAIDP
jgi:SGNH domain (fused to AT3 domains)